MANKKTKLEVKGNEITVFTHNTNDYISLTDITLYNPGFKPLEFEGFRKWY